MKKSYVSLMSRCQSSRMLDPKLIKDYLQINVFPDLVVVEQEGSPYALQKKATRGAAVNGVRDSWQDAAKLDSLDVNISFYEVFPVLWKPAFPV